MRKFPSVSWLKYVTKEYLGFDDDKGFIYSLKHSDTKYSVVAVKNGDVDVLITYNVKKPVAIPAANYQLSNEYTQELLNN